MLTARTFRVFATGMSLAGSMSSCSKCKDASATVTCVVCNQKHCVEHVTEHCRNVSNDVEEVRSDYDYLARQLKHIDCSQKLMTQIDEWEQNSHKIITGAAFRARADVHRWIEMSRTDMETSMAKMKITVQTEKSDDYHMGKELLLLKRTLRRLQTMLEKHSTIHLQTDEQARPIPLIKVVWKDSLKPSVKSKSSTRLGAFV